MGVKKLSSGDNSWVGFLGNPCRRIYQETIYERFLGGLPYGFMLLSSSTHQKTYNKCFCIQKKLYLSCTCFLNEWDIGHGYSGGVDGVALVVTLRWLGRCLEVQMSPVLQRRVEWHAAVVLRQPRVWSVQTITVVVPLVTTHTPFTTHDTAL